MKVTIELTKDIAAILSPEEAKEVLLQLLQESQAKDTFFKKESSPSIEAKPEIEANTSTDSQADILLDCQPKSQQVVPTKAKVPVIEAKQAKTPIEAKQAIKKEFHRNKNDGLQKTITDELVLEVALRIAKGEKLTSICEETGLKYNSIWIRLKRFKKKV